MSLSACGHEDLTKRMTLLEEQGEVNEDFARTAVLYRNREALRRFADQRSQRSSPDADPFQYRQEDNFFFRNLRNLKGWSAYTLDQFTEELIGGGDYGSD